MLKFLGLEQNSKIYKQLSKLGIFSDNMVIQYIKYQQYFRGLTNTKIMFNDYIKTLMKEKQNALLIIKSLLFVHAYLQSITILDNTQQFLNLMSYYLKSTTQLIEKLRQIKINQLKHNKSRSVVMNLDLQKKSIQIGFDKQIFLLTDIIRPYILYIQKIVSVFSFYSSIKKNLFKFINVNQAWVVMNFFKCANAIISKIPIICRFIRKSYKPIAESLAQAFSLDFSFFYHKIYKFIYNECSRIQHNYDTLAQKIGQIQAFIKGIDETKGIVKLIEQIQQLNIQLYALYGQQSFKGNRNIIQLIPIDTNDQQIQFILYLQKMKNNAQLYEKTPKFFRSYQSKRTTQHQKQQDGPINLAVFRDISNQNHQNNQNKSKLMTFRKVEEVNDVQDQITSHIMQIKPLKLKN